MEIPLRPKLRNPDGGLAPSTEQRVYPPTVALKYTSALRLDSVVKIHWNGNGVELIANAGG